MLKDDNDRVRLTHMFEAASEAVVFARGKQRSDLDADRMLSLSLVKLIEVVGEAANNVSEVGQAQYSQIPWPDIVGMRHRLIHGYFDVDLDIVWAVVANDLPPLITELEKILASVEPPKEN